MNPGDHDKSALPLEELDIVPQWVKAPVRSFESHSGEDRPDRRGKPRRYDDMGERRRGPRPPKSGRPDRFDRPDRRREKGGRPRRPSKPSAPPLEPAAVTVSFLPEEKGFAALIDAMKRSPRAYPLFDLARLILNKPERHVVRLKRKPLADGSHAPLHLVILCGTPFLGQDEAVRFAFRRHAKGLFRENKQAIDPPKGNFTFVNRCGITGVWLGPPNYHEYQSRIVRHHQQRLRHVPFEEFKAKIQTVRDPEAVQTWIDSMSVKSEYECLLCAEAERKMFSTRGEVEAHCLGTHQDKLLAVAEELHMPGEASRKLENAAVLESIRLAWHSERRFPLNTAHGLSPQLAKEGFHFFKDPKGVTYITHIKPKRFEPNDGLSSQVRTIMAFLRANNGCTLKELIAHVLPPAALPEEATATAPAKPAKAASKAPAVPPVPTVEEERLLADLHWLIQDGYVVEFSNGRLWALKEKPPKPEPPPPPPAAEAKPETPAAEPAPEPASPPAETAPTPTAAPAAEAVPATPAEAQSAEAEEPGIVIKPEIIFSNSGEA